jgi:hypothetical protein
VRLAQRNVPLHGFELPEDLRTVDRIGNRHFARAKEYRTLERALRVVGDVHQRIEILDAVTGISTAEYRTYYWAGVAMALVFMETPKSEPRQVRLQRRS